MAVDAHANFGYSTVLTAPSPATSGTSLVVQSGDGTKFPTVSFNAVVWPAGVQPLSTNSEIVRVTTISTDTFTITRAQESTSARTIVVGDQISAAITKKSLTDIENQLDGTTSQQSPALFTPTLTAPSIHAWNGWGKTGTTSGTLLAWTRASNTTATISSLTDLTSIYPTGTRMWWKESGTSKYAVIVGNSYAAGPLTHTITFTGGDDYVMAATPDAGTSMVSYAMNPQGWPGWFAYTPTYTGFSSAPATPVFRFRLDGNMCTYVIHDAANGTSNTTGFTITLPITALTLTNAAWQGVGRGTDNGTALTTPSSITVTTGGTTATISKDWTAAGGTWTSSGSKRIAGGLIIYEV